MLRFSPPTNIINSVHRGAKNKGLKFRDPAIYPPNVEILKGNLAPTH
jgi:hypothetical protein